MKAFDWIIAIYFFIVERLELSLTIVSIGALIILILVQDNKRKKEIHSLSDELNRVKYDDHKPSVVKGWIKEQLNILYEEVKFMLNEIKSSEMSEGEKDDKK